MIDPARFEGLATRLRQATRAREIAQAVLEEARSEEMLAKRELRVYILTEAGLPLQTML